MNKIILAAVITLTILGLAAIVVNTDTDAELHQTDLKTKSQEIDILNEKLDKNNETKAKTQKELDKKLKENQELQKEVERLQAKKDEERRIAAEEARNAVVASPEPVQAVSTAPVGNIEQIVRDAAVAHGLSPDHFASIARCESGFNPNAVNHGYYENGNPSGLFQHLSGYWPARAAAHGYPGASVFDAVANANVTASMWASGSSHLWECQ